MNEENRTKYIQKHLELREKLNNGGETIIIVTHDKNIAEHANYTIQLKDGQIMNGIKNLLKLLWDQIKLIRIFKIELLRRLNYNISSPFIRIKELKGQSIRILLQFNFLIIYKTEYLL